MAAATQFGSNRRIGEARKPGPGTAETRDAVQAFGGHEHPQPPRCLAERVADLDDSDGDPFERDDYADECGDTDAQHLPRLEASGSEPEADQLEPGTESDSSDLARRRRHDYGWR